MTHEIERVFTLTLQTRVANLTGELRGVVLDDKDDRHVAMLVENLRQDGWRVEEVKICPYCREPIRPGDEHFDPNDLRNIHVAPGVSACSIAQQPTSKGTR